MQGMWVIGGMELYGQRLVVCSLGYLEFCMFGFFGEFFSFGEQVDGDYLVVFLVGDFFGDVVFVGCVVVFVVVVVQFVVFVWMYEQ